MKRLLMLLALIIVLILGYFFIFRSTPVPITKLTPPSTSSTPYTDITPNSNSPRIEIIATDLEVPWALAFLPNGHLLVTERPGNIQLIQFDGSKKEVTRIPEVKQIGEGGLHGIALHPDYGNNNYIYIYYTYGGTNNQTLNRVARYKYENNAFTNATTIVDAIPGAANHDGGRIKFGPDGYLYIATGDAQEPSLAQNRSSLAGKILRVTDEGKAAPGNPFSDRIYSYGHRNPQGLTWDEGGQLYETEHGSTQFDEVNKIEPGKNYGWPDIRGDQEKTGMEKPLMHSGTETWAPSGLVFLNGSLFFGGLRGQALFQLTLSSLPPTGGLTPHLKSEFGRIREVIMGPDGMLYITTSNRDGRAIPGAQDDKIIRVNPAKL